MRKYSRSAVAFLFAFALICSFAMPFGKAASTNPSVVVDGKAVQFSSDMGVPFVDSNNRTQVPLRAAMEAMGAKVEWDAEVRTAVVTKGYVTVRVPIGAEFVWINSEKKTNDTAAVIVNSRTYLPIRIVAEALGADVVWDGNTKTVKITTHGDPVVWVRTGESWHSYDYTGEYEGSTEYTINKKEKVMGIDGMTEYSFNKRGQLESKTVAFEMDQEYTITISFTYNSVGLMTYFVSTHKALKTGEEWVEEAWYEYNSKGDVTTIKELFHGLNDDINSSNQIDCKYTYDKQGRVSKMVVYNPPAGQDVPPDRVIYDYTYDSFDRITEEQIEKIYRKSADIPPDKFLIKNEYDEYGNLVQQTTHYLPEDNSSILPYETRYSYRQFDPTTMSPDYLLFPVSKGISMIWPSDFLEPNALYYLT